MKILSFVIPAYNSAQYLPKCIGSMLSPQVLDALEIIVVNDGSQDNTVEVVREYETRYPGVVRLLSQENRGHGGALNTGCAAATGRYLRVIDADDWVETESIPPLVELLGACQSDVVVTHYRTHHILTGERKDWRSVPPAFGRELTMAQVMEHLAGFDEVLTFHGLTYNTRFYREKGIRLSEQVFYEDQEFGTLPCCYAESILILDMFLYNYRIGDANQSMAEANQAKRIGHIETVLRRLLEEYDALTLPENHPGRAYFQWKVKVLLLGYVNTATLILPDRKQGRDKAAAMMTLVQQQLPQAWAMARKQYQIYRLLNHLHLSKAMWDRLFQSRLYRLLRGNHNNT